MRSIGTISTEADAIRFHNYLVHRDIEHNIEGSIDGIQVWIIDEADVEEMRSELAEFLIDPSDPSFDAPKARATKPKKQRSIRPSRGLFPNLDTPITRVLIIGSVIVTLITWFGEKNFRVLEALFISKFINGGLIEIRQGQIWRLFTPMFIHLSPLHLVFNLIWTYQLGMSIERMKGSGTLLFLVVMTSLAANLPQYYFVGPGFGGLSGVVYGLFGYVWMKSKFDPFSNFWIPQNTVTLMIVWLFLCMTGVLGHVANHAHVGGLIAGMLIGFAAARFRI